MIFFVILIVAPEWVNLPVELMGKESREIKQFVYVNSISCKENDIHKLKTSMRIQISYVPK